MDSQKMLKKRWCHARGDEGFGVGVLWRASSRGGYEITQSHCGAQVTVSDLLVRSPEQALRIHTRELDAVVLGERTAPAPPNPKQTPEARATALRPDPCSLAAASSREAYIPAHR